MIHKEMADKPFGKEAKRGFWAMWGGVFAVLRHLSLDVVLGSVCMGWLAVFVTSAQLPIVWWFFLPVGVWLVYSLDHLVDAARIGPDAQTMRHRFHAHYFTQIRLAATLLAVLTAIAAFLMLSPTLLVFGAWMVTASMLHVWLARKIGGRVRPWLTKELAVAFVYTLGIWGGPLLYSRSIDTTVWHTLFSSFCLAAANLVFFARMEIENDQRDGHSSLARVLGVRGSDFLALTFCLLPLLSFLLSGISLLSGDIRIWGSFVILMLMATASLALILGAQKSLVKRNYRTWGDAIFFFPVLLYVLWFIAWQFP